MPDADRVQSTLVYQALLSNPLNILRQLTLNVAPLAPVADGAVTNLFFAAGLHDLAIDSTQALAAGSVGAHVDAGIQRAMMATSMRGHALPVGAGGGARHQATVLRPGAGADLWVTEMQTGCTVLIVDWGGGQYSMTHMQPSTDAQFNRFGQAVLGAGRATRAGYQNAWLKQELTSVITNTGGAPQYYIMIQSMFDTWRGNVVQVVGVRQRGQFQFYRQKQNGNVITVEHLTWCGWYSFLPYRSY
jgi:hypothetical protein